MSPETLAEREPYRGRHERVQSCRPVAGAPDRARLSGGHSRWYGHRGDDGALPEQQPALQEQGALVVEEVAPPVAHDELGDDDRDDVVVAAGVELVDVAQDRPGELPVRASRRSRAGCRCRTRSQAARSAPAPPRRRRPCTATRWFGSQRPRVGERLEHAPVDAPTSTTTVWFMRRGRKSGVDPQARRRPACSGAWIALNSRMMQRDHHDRHPRAARELRDRHDEQHDERRDRADAVDHDVALPARLLLLLVVTHHARLRERERREHADGVERDQRVGDAAEGDDAAAPAAPARNEDAVREHEPVAAVGELAGQVAVAGDDRRQPREVGVGGVGGEGEDRRGRELQHEVDDGAVAEHRAAHLRDHRLLVARVRVEVVREHRHAEEQRAEDDAPSTSASSPRSSTPAAGTRARRSRSPRRRSARPRPTRSPSGGGRGRATRR